MIEAIKRAVRQLVGPRVLMRRRISRGLAHQEPETELIALLADKSKAFLDIGANVGVYSFLALDHFSHVHAVEANPDLARDLRRLLGKGGTVFEVAASDHAAQLEFSIPVAGGADIHTRGSLESAANQGLQTRTIKVSAMPIDSLRMGPIALVKIDVEGHEIQAVKGARETIAKHRPVLVIECEERHSADAVGRLTEWFGTLGYKGHFIHRGKLFPVETFSPEKLQNADNIKGVGSAPSPDYVNNFIFVHGDDSRATGILQRRFA